MASSELMFVNNFFFRKETPANAHIKVPENKMDDSVYCTSSKDDVGVGLEHLEVSFCQREQPHLFVRTKDKSTAANFAKSTESTMTRSNKEHRPMSDLKSWMADRWNVPGSPFG